MQLFACKLPSINFFITSKNQNRLKKVEEGLCKVIKTSYLEVYIDEIVPRLRSIDLHLKSGDGFDVSTVSDLLDITEKEVILLRGGMSETIAADEFLNIMRRGSSLVCGMYRRELERCSPTIYTIDDVAYIYSLDYELVQIAFEKLNAASVTEYLLPEVFAQIWF